LTELQTKICCFMNHDVSSVVRKTIQPASPMLPLIYGTSPNFAVYNPFDDTSPITRPYRNSISVCQRRHLPPLIMGVNATGTLGGSQVERRRRENRGAVGGEGSGACGGAVPLPRKFINFFISKWRDMVHLMHSECVVFKTHVSHGL